MQERILVNANKVQSAVTTQEHMIEVDANRLENIVPMQAGMNRAQPARL